MQTSLGKDGKAEHLLTSPTPKPFESSLGSMNKIGSKGMNPDQDMDYTVNATTVSNFGIAGTQSPFRTPPSLSCCPDKVMLFS